MATPSCHLVDGVLHLGSEPVLRVPAGWSIVDDLSGTGVFLHARAAEPASCVELFLGRIVDNAARTPWSAGADARAFSPGRVGNLLPTR